ncbi:bidirectional sugar transporter SWEET4-like isoform X3 [Carex rostrata]
MPTFYRVWKKGSVEQFSPIPYVVTVINCMIWVLYGVPVVHPHSTLVITTSGSGLVVELFYVLVFLFYSQGRKRLLVLIMLIASIIIVGIFALLVIMLVHTHERRSMIVGILGGASSISMYAAPLSVMKMVIQTKSVEYMPLSLSVATFFNGACWGGYALIPFDPYICIPSVVGVLLAIVQLLLYGMYYKSTQSQIAARRRKEEMAMAEVAVMRDGDNKILTRDVLQRRNIGGRTECAMCQNCNLETALHLLILCPFAKQVWSQVSMKLGYKLIEEGRSLEETWSKSILQTIAKPTDWRITGPVRIICVCWWIWRQRNAVVFAGKEMRPQQLADLICMEMMLWMRYC